MAEIDSLRGRSTLCIVQCAAMVELTVMPIWVGALMQYYLFDAQQAGSLLSFYVIGAVISCVALAKIVHKFDTGKYIAIAGLAVCSVMFFRLSFASTYGEMAALHLVCGLAIGTVLAVTEGTISRSSNPHRLFAMSHIALNVLAAILLATMPTAMAHFGGFLFYKVIAAIMFAGLISSLIGFPSGLGHAHAEQNPKRPKAPIPVSVWIIMAGLFLMSANHTMTLSFVERAGNHRGYSTALITSVITAMAVIKLFPAALAAILEKYVSLRVVLFATPVIQALCALAVFTVPHPVLYSVAAPLFIAALMFANVFIFAYISLQDQSGRAAAAMPSVVLVGTGMSAFLGGSLVKAFGYESLGLAVTAIAMAAIVCFSRVAITPSPSPQPSTAELKSGSAG